MLSQNTQAMLHPFDTLSDYWLSLFHSLAITFSPGVSHSLKDLDHDVHTSFKTFKLKVPSIINHLHGNKDAITTLEGICVP